MAQAQNVIEEGRDRFGAALRDLEKDWKRFQKQAEKRRKELEKRAEREVRRLRTELRKNPLVKRAEQEAKRLEKRADKVRSEIRKSPAVQRAEAFRKDAEKAIEEQVDTLLGVLRIANTNDLEKVERKLNQLNRKVRALEKAEGAAAHPGAAA